MNAQIIVSLLSAVAIGLFCMRPIVSGAHRVHASAAVFVALVSALAMEVFWMLRASEPGLLVLLLLWSLAHVFLARSQMRERRALPKSEVWEHQLLQSRFVTTQLLLSAPSLLALIVLVGFQFFADDVFPDFALLRPDLALAP